MNTPKTKIHDGFMAMLFRFKLEGLSEDEIFNRLKEYIDVIWEDREHWRSFEVYLPEIVHEEVVSNMDSCRAALTYFDIGSPRLRLLEDDRYPDKIIMGHVLVEGINTLLERYIKATGTTQDTEK